MSETADAAFDRNIPKDHQYDVMVMIAEAAQDERHGHECITILDRDRSDAINVRAHGIIEFQGNEYTFIVEDGNWNGTTLEDWDGGKAFEPLPRTQWALQPRDDIVNQAIMANRGPFLIAKWDAFLRKPEVAEIPGKYSYDRYFQPGCKVEDYWKAKADEFQMVLVTQDTADETRAALAKARGEQP